ncbi:MAG: DUF3788 family protein [Archangium sp.]|nr:DUF3788 family protein [Archangium sp.]
MSTNVLNDAADQPTDPQVKAALGPAWEHFEVLRAATATCEHEWRHYGKKYGWKLKVHADDKVLFELTVADGWFLVSLALREKERLELKGDALQALASPEGFVKLEVRDAASCERALALVRFIMARRQPAAEQ